MRDPNRLDSLYDEIKEIHKQTAPDQRLGQFLMNMLGGIQSISKRDIFFIEDDKMLEYLKQYAHSKDPYFRGQDLYDKFE